MSKTEMLQTYENACNKARRAADPGEFKAWMNKLSMFSRRDIDEALSGWYQGSHFLPTANDLYPIASRIVSARLAEASSTKLLAGWKCPNCRMTCTGFIDPDDNKTRKCRRCSHAMTQVLRERYTTEAA